MTSKIGDKYIWLGSNGVFWLTNNTYRIVEILQDTVVITTENGHAYTDDPIGKKCSWKPLIIKHSNNLPSWF